MPTAKQKKVAELIIENATLDKPLNGGEMLAKVGYSESMQTAKVNDVLESEGVKEALEDLGFTEDNAKKVVGQILLNEKVEPNARLKAADQVFKVHGTYAPEKHESKSIHVNITPQLLEVAKKYEEELNKVEDEKVSGELPE